MPSVWRRSGMVEFDNSGDPAAGAQAFFYAGATTTPITVYQDATESTPHTSPVEADGNGRWPLVFIPFRTDFDEKVTDEGGTQLSYYARIPNADPVEAAADTALPEELISTGDVIWRPVGGARSGCVRCNGRTMGDASSGATERANADTANLFTHLWNGLADGQAAVSTGRGASAAADYAAHKTITLPDLRFATIKGAADMGNTALAVSGFVPFAHGSSITAGSYIGEQTNTLTIAKLAAHTHGVGTYTVDSNGAHTHSGTTGTDSVDHTHTFSASTSPGVRTAGVQAIAPNSGSTGTVVTGTGGVSVYPTNQFQNIDNVSVSVSGTTSGVSAFHTHNFSISSSGTHTHALTGSSSSVGSGEAHNNEPPAILGTFHMKL